MNIQNVTLSFFQNVTTQEKIRDNTLQEYVSLVRNGGNFQESVMKARTEFTSNGKTALYDALKRRLPCVTASCTVNKKGRSKQHVEKTNGFIVLDVDLKENVNPEIYDAIKNDPYTQIVHKSVSGTGFCIFVKINANKFTESFRGLEKYYAETFGLEVDKSCKNVNRLRFMSFDQEIHVNESSTKFTDYIKEIKAPKNSPSVIYTQDELSQYIQRIVDNGMPVDSDSYEGWVACAMAIQSVESGMSGFMLFDAISKLSLKYDAKLTEMKWNQCSGDGSVGIGTLYHFGAQLGVKQRYSDNTSKLISMTSNHKKQSGKHSSLLSATEYIATINPEVIIDAAIVEKVLNSDEDFSKGLTNDSEIQQLQEFIFDNYKPRVNIYSEVTEVNDKPLSDRLRNGIVIDCKNVFDGKFKVNDNDVDKILYSPNIPDFDPIQEFLQENKDLKAEGNIQKLADSLVLDGQTDEFKNLFVRKWLISLFAYRSFEGYSPLTLVLSGGQNVGKTYWFRNLLPKSLINEFYAENQLTGKLEDIFQIMSKSLLIVNDEFSVSTKKSSEAFKELVSKSELVYRKPYGKEVLHKKRISVFAGTTNNTDILVDNTGNRRILVFNLKDIKHDLYNDIDKDELFLEIFRLYQQKEDGFRLSKEEVQLLNDQTADMEAVSIEEETILDGFKTCQHEDDSAMQMKDIIAALNGDGTFIQYNQGKIKGALTKLGFTQKRVKSKRPFNITKKGW